MRRALITLAAFLSAAACLAVELTVVRLGAPFVGASLVPWSAAIACVLLGLSLGHRLAGGIASGESAMRRALGLAWLGGAACVLMMPLALGAMEEQGLFREPLAPSAPFAVAALALLPSLAAGLSGPLTMRLAILTDPARQNRAIGSIYAAAALGSVAGTALTGFVLLDRIGSIGMVQAIGALWALMGLCILPWRSIAANRSRREIVAGGAAFAILAGLFIVQTMTIAGPCQQESRYNCIRLFDRHTDEGGLMRTIMLDEAVHSASDRDDPRRLPLPYAAMADALAGHAFSGRPEARALLVGGGGASLARAWVARQPPVAVTVAELDAKVAAIAARDLWADTPAITTRIGDGRAVLRALAQDTPFDVILLDAYRTFSVPPHLVTREFNALAAAHLRADGLFLSNVIDNLSSPALAASVARTLRETFPRVDIWMESGARGVTNIIVAAWRDPGRALDAETLAVPSTRIDADGIARKDITIWRRLDASAFAALHPGACALLLTDDRAPVEHLLAGRVRC